MTASIHLALPTSTAPALPAPARRRPARAAALIAPVVVMLAAALAAWLRLEPETRATLWAEDVRNFLSNDVHDGLGHTLFRPYGGYLQVVPRLLAAAVAHLVPVGDWATAVCFSACVAAGIVAATVYVCAGQILHSRLLGAAAASITVLDPLAAHEVLGNLANLHWFVIWMIPWVLLYRPASRWSAALIGAIVLLAALSEFDVVLFLPLLAWRWRDRALLPVRIPFLLGCVAEVIAEIVSPRHRPGGLTFGAADVINGYLINAVMSILTPVRTQVGVMLHSGGTMVAVAVLAAAAALAAYTLRRGDARMRILTVVVVILSPGLLISALELTPEKEYAYAHLNSTQLGDPWLVRYGVVPSMLLLALVPLAAAAHGRQGRGMPARRAVRFAAAALLAVPLLAHVSPANDELRAHGPAFAPQVAEAVQDCQTSSPLESEALVGAPSGEWKISLSCEQLEHGVWGASKR